jgi:hypothetical protein
MAQLRHDLLVGKESLYHLTEVNELVVIGPNEGE